MSSARSAHAPSLGSSGTFLPVKGHSTMATVTFDNATRALPRRRHAPRSTSSTSRSATASSSSSSAPPAAASPPRCACSPASRRSTPGRILIGDRDVTDVPPKDRDIAMVFQNYALYPHMTVAENMGFALKIAGVAKDELRKRVVEAAKLLDLEAVPDRKPKALSGGQRQRVAMGRAIVRQPQVFLMDEPLSNLDAKLRVQTRTQIASLQRRLGVTTVYVTHDQIEAMTMGDRVAVLKDGLLQQVGTPRDLYEKPEQRLRRRLHRLPRDEPVRARRSPTAASSSAPVRPARPRARSAAAGGSQVTVGVRPEDIGRPGRRHGPLGRRRPRRGARRRRLPLRPHRDQDGERTDIVARVDGRRPPNAGRDGHLAAASRATCTCSTSSRASA